MFTDTITFVLQGPYSLIDRVYKFCYNMNLEFI